MGAALALWCCPCDAPRALTLPATQLMNAPFSLSKNPVRNRRTFAIISDRKSVV
jgi:hypothetical protein